MNKHKRVKEIGGYSLYLFNLYLLHGLRKVNAELKKLGLYKYKYQGHLERVNLIRSIYNEPPLSKKQYRIWVVKSFDNGTHPIIKRMESENFYLNKPWIILRKEVLNKYGEVCMKCGSTKRLEVDHIKPRSYYPELELDINNLQVLCKSCNCSKSNRKIFDLRPKLNLQLI